MKSRIESRKDQMAGRPRDERRGILRAHGHWFACDFRLHVWDGRPHRLFELNLGTQQQSAEAQVRQRQHDVEILVHVTMVQQMMTVEPEENSRALHVALARQMGPGKTIVTILCDTGFRYLSTLYNAEWLQSKGLSLFSGATA